MSSMTIARDCESKTKVILLRMALGSMVGIPPEDIAESSCAEGCPLELGSVLASWQFLRDLPCGASPADFSRIQDVLIAPARGETSGSPDFRFLVENQGNWECCFNLREGPSYPVYINRYDQLEDRQSLGEDLVDLLITYSFRELIFSSSKTMELDQAAGGQFLRDWTPLWSGVYPGEGTCTFYLQGRKVGQVFQDGVRIGSFEDDTPKTDDSISMLEFIPSGYPGACSLKISLAKDGQITIKHGFPKSNRMKLMQPSDSFSMLVQEAQRRSFASDRGARWLVAFWKENGGDSLSAAMEEEDVRWLLDRALDEVNDCDITKDARELIASAF